MALLLTALSLSACGALESLGLGAAPSPDPEEGIGGGELVDVQLAIEQTLTAVPTLIPQPTEIFLPPTHTSTVTATQVIVPTVDHSPTVPGFQFTSLASTLTAVVASSTPTASITPDPGDVAATETQMIEDFGTPTYTPAPGSCNAMRFVYDNTIADGSLIQPGDFFYKEWRIQNVGICTWVAGYTLAFHSGFQMDGASPIALAYDVVPGAYINVGVTLQAPITPGTYRGSWIMVAADGIPFGWGPDVDEPIWVEIIVPGGPVPTAVPFSTATLTPEP